MPEKVCILPSSELTTIFGKIGRQASYIVCENLWPGKIVLGCMPALFTGIQEDIDFITDYPVITLEGHPMHHAGILVKKYSQKVDVEIDIEKLLKKNKLDVTDSSPEKLGPKGKKAVKLLSEYVALKVKNLFYLEHG